MIANGQLPPALYVHYHFKVETIFPLEKKLDLKRSFLKDYVQSDVDINAFAKGIIHTPCIQIDDQRPIYSIRDANHPSFWLKVDLQQMKARGRIPRYELRESLFAGIHLEDKVCNIGKYQHAFVVKYIEDPLLFDVDCYKITHRNVPQFHLYIDIPILK